MPLNTIDWPNITASLAAAMGGWVAASVTKRQLTAVTDNAEAGRSS